MSPQRRRLIAAGLGLLGAQRFGHAQPAATIRRVGTLHPGSEVDAAGMRVPFKQGMLEHGWLEAQNVAYASVYADGDAGRLDTLARELVEQGVDVIVAYECTRCRTLLRPRAGDCCVFCSYGSVPCPPIQQQRGCCGSPDA